MSIERVTERYFLSSYDLEQIEDGQNVELLTKDNRLIILALTPKEEEE